MSVFFGAGTGCTPPKNVVHFYWVGLGADSKQDKDGVTLAELTVAGRKFPYKLISVHTRNRIDGNAEWQVVKQCTAGVNAKTSTHIQVQAERVIPYLIDPDVVCVILSGHSYGGMQASHVAEYLAKYEDGVYTKKIALVTIGSIYIPYQPPFFSINLMYLNDVALKCNKIVQPKLTAEFMEGFTTGAELGTFYGKKIILLDNKVRAHALLQTRGLNKVAEFVWLDHDIPDQKKKSLAERVLGTTGEWEIHNAYTESLLQSVVDQIRDAAVERVPIRSEYMRTDL